MIRPALALLLALAALLPAPASARPVEHATYYLNGDYDNNRVASTGLFDSVGGGSNMGGAWFQPIAGDTKVAAWGDDIKAGNDFTLELCQEANGVCIARAIGCGNGVLKLADTTHPVKVLVHTRDAYVGCPLEVAVPLSGTLNVQFS